MNVLKYLAAIGLLAAPTLIAHAADAPPVERFVALVQSGQDLSTSPFAPMISAEDAAKLLKIAKCEAGPPRYSKSGSAVILWDCTHLPETNSVGTMLSMNNGVITSIVVMSAVIQRVRPQ